MCQKRAVKFSHVIHIRKEGGREGGGCEEQKEEEEEDGREGKGREGWRGRRRGVRHKGWSDAVAVIKPASTNTSQVYSTETQSTPCMLWISKSTTGTISV